MSDDLARVFVQAMDDRERYGRHRHHRQCIHNLSPEEQVAARGKTPEQWLQIHGSLPEQITPEQWEREPYLPDSSGERGGIA